MACKHEGGVEPCDRFTGSRRQCKVYMAKYRKDNLVSSAVSRGRAGDSGYAGELIVRTELLLLGLDVTVPENRTCPDDVHFRSVKGDWVSVQVKVATVNRSTGYWDCRRRNRGSITSDIIAWVDVRAREVRYEENTKRVPPELLT